MTGACDTAVSQIAGGQTTASTPGSGSSAPATARASPYCLRLRGRVHLPVAGDQRSTHRSRSVLGWQVPPGGGVGDSWPSGLTPRLLARVSRSASGWRRRWVGGLAQGERKVRIERRATARSRMADSWRSAARTVRRRLAASALMTRLRRFCTSWPTARGLEVEQRAVGTGEAQQGGHLLVALHIHDVASPSLKHGGAHLGGGQATAQLGGARSAAEDPLEVGTAARERDRGGAEQHAAEPGAAVTGGGMGPFPAADGGAIHDDAQVMAGIFQLGVGVPPRGAEPAALMPEQGGELEGHAGGGVVERRDPAGHPVPRQQAGQLRALAVVARRLDARQLPLHLGGDHHAPRVTRRLLSGAGCVAGGAGRRDPPAAAASARRPAWPGRDGARWPGRPGSPRR